MDLRFWVRLCAISLLLFSVALLVLSANGLRIYRISQDDLSASLVLVADLFNETGTPDVVVVPFATWNQININLYAVEDRWNTQVALAIAGITIICLCFGFQIAILLLPYRQKGEQLSLLSRTAMPNYQNPNSYGSLPRAGPPNESSKKLAMMCEGALYEPWNQATLDKLSSEEAPPATKITRAIYRYGPIAGKILMRRFGHMLSDAELSEVERILNFGQDVNGAPNLNLNFSTGSPNPVRGRDPATSNIVNSNNNNNNNSISTPPSSPTNR